MDIRHLTGRTQPIAPVREQGGQPVSVPKTTPLGETFAEVLDRVTESGSRVTFTGHAMKRLEDRNINFDEGALARLEEAIDRAGAKGSRESLILDGDAAYVVNIQKRTVITAVDQLELRDRVFTQIDSTVLTKPNHM